jgi:cytochrome c553
MRWLLNEIEAGLAEGRKRWQIGGDEAFRRATKRAALTTKAEPAAMMSFCVACHEPARRKEEDETTMSTRVESRRSPTA